MGWDVFISHASEDKAAVAVPLKSALEQMSLSAWIDIEQIKLGDSFRSGIDRGLQHCRYGIIVLSPNFFKKPWAQAELDAFLNMEMAADGTKKLLPVVHGMTFNELSQHSQLLATRKAVRWDAGISNVVQAIVEVVEGQVTHASLQPSREPPAAPETDPAALVCFLLEDGRTGFLESLEVEATAEDVMLTLKCDDPVDAALLQDLGKSHSDRLHIAFGTTAMVGRVEHAKLVQREGKQTGILRFRNTTRDLGIMGEIAFNGYSADQLAEMRARRILLNEKHQWSNGSGTIDIVNQAMLDTFVAGQGGYLKTNESPLPQFYAKLKGKPALFIGVARVLAVMFLRLTNTVEHVLRLDLRLEGEKLHVDFKGRRARVYMNVEPPEIEVKGVLDLQNGNE